MILGDPIGMVVVVLSLGFLYICGFIAGGLDRAPRKPTPVPKARLIRYVGIVR